MKIHCWCERILLYKRQIDRNVGTECKSEHNDCDTIADEDNEDDDDDDDDTTAGGGTRVQASK